MKAEANCEKCGKDVKVKSIYFAGFHCNVYFDCGHHVHYIFAGQVVETKKKVREVKGAP